MVDFHPYSSGRDNLLVHIGARSKSSVSTFINLENTAAKRINKIHVTINKRTEIDKKINNKTL